MITNRDGIELARRAYAAMAASFSPCPAHLIPSFRLWHFPLAGPHLSWVLFHGRVEDPLDRAPMLRRLIWDRDADLERLELGKRRKPILQPALSIDELEVDPSKLSELMNEANKLALSQKHLVRPYLTDQRTEFGLEGFDVEGTDGRPIVRIEWNRNLPPALEAIAGWAGRVRDWLRQVLGYPHKP